MSQYGRVPTGSGKISIKSLDTGLIVHAQYNPKELQIDRTVPWSPTGEAGKVNSTAASSGGVHLEFTGAQGRTLSVEMLFDGYETGGGPGFTVDVGSQVKILETLASVIKAQGKEDERRPHHCMVVWGTSLMDFKCVIESLSTKYTMFDPSGKPLRATCTVKLKEAASVKASDAAAGKPPTEAKK